MSGDHNMHCSANTKCTRCGKENPAEIHTCTPLALKLAIDLEDSCIFVGHEAASELRRLYMLNAELVKTLKWLDNWLGAKPMPECAKRITAVLKKAKGGSNAD